ncbi:hypothetical protein TYRP_012905 [Tyrophagus putrescentiae]|nr:hypothetical protein TYRP_012905 [Tyrophagus putrescentiae]
MASSKTINFSTSTTYLLHDVLEADVGHHLDDADDIGEEDAKGVVLPQVENGRLVGGHAQRHEDDHVEEDAQQQGNGAEEEHPGDEQFPQQRHPPHQLRRVEAGDLAHPDDEAIGAVHQHQIPVDADGGGVELIHANVADVDVAVEEVEQLATGHDGHGEHEDAKEEERPAEGGDQEEDAQVKEAGPFVGWPLLTSRLLGRLLLSLAKGKVIRLDDVRQENAKDEQLQDKLEWRFAVKKKVGQTLLYGENGKEHHQHDDGAEDDHAEDAPLTVDQYRQVDHLIDRVEVGVVQVANEPEDARADRLLDHQHKGDKVEDADHAHQPVDEERGARRGEEGVQAAVEGGAKERQRADVQPPADDEGKEANLEGDQQGHLDDDVAEAKEALDALQMCQAEGGVQGKEEETDDERLKEAKVKWAFQPVRRPHADDLLPEPDEEDEGAEGAHHHAAAVEAVREEIFRLVELKGEAKDVVKGVVEEEHAVSGITTSQAMATRVYCTQYRATVPRHRAMTLKMSFRGNRFGMSGEYTKR